MQQRLQSEVSVDNGLDDFMAGLARRYPGGPEFRIIFRAGREDDEEQSK